MHACRRRAWISGHPLGKAPTVDRTGPGMAWHGVAECLLPLAVLSLLDPGIGSAGEAEKAKSRTRAARDCANTSSSRLGVGAGEANSSLAHLLALSLTPGGTDSASRRRRRGTQGLPAPCPWARQTCSTGVVYKSSLSHSHSLSRCQPDLHASGATSLQLRQCAAAR
jgi:hypothetical protein